MPGMKRTKVSLRIIKLKSEGMSNAEIVRLTFKTKSQVASVIRRARQDGLLPPAVVQVKYVKDLHRVYGVKTGAMCSTLEQTTTPEVWKFAAVQVQDGGYATISEYLVDLLTEAYYAHFVAEEGRS